MKKNKPVVNDTQIPGVKITPVKVVAPDSDLKVVFGLPKDAEIRLRGLLPLALNPATSNATLPAKFLSHTLVRDRYFFALPQDVWNRICAEFGNDAFDQELVELEGAVAKICGDCSFNVGLRSGGAFSYPLLRSSSQRANITSATDHRIGSKADQAKLAFALRQADARLKPLMVVSRGYAGWLMTCRQFLDEHDAIFSKWSDMVLRWGLDKLGILMPKGMFLPGNDPTSDPKWFDYIREFEEFFSRWRLQGMAAPYLPVPLRPLMAGMLAPSLLPQLNRAGGVFCLPDTFPVPSRDELRNLLEGALHGADKPDHLTEWMKFIAKDNVGKKPIARFARLFEFQHYFRILHHRHAAAFRRKSKTLKQELARILGTSKKTIISDLRFARKRLGKDWLERGKSSSIGPF